jgi:hypothetical protein
MVELRTYCVRFSTIGPGSAAGVRPFPLSDVVRAIASA